MTCEKCGAAVPDGQTICPDCQAAVAQPAAQGAPPAPAVPPPPTQRPAPPPPPPQPQYAQPPYPYAPQQYAPPAAQPTRPGKPVVVIIIAILLFIGAFFCLIQAAMGQPSMLFGTMVVGAAGRLLSLFWGFLAAAVGLGLILMTRWGWWLAMGQSLFSVLSALVGIPKIDELVNTLMQAQTLPPDAPPEIMEMSMAMAKVCATGGIIFGTLLQIAIVAYLIWKRDLFGIDVGRKTAGS